MLTCRRLACVVAVAVSLLVSGCFFERDEHEGHRDRHDPPGDQAQPAAPTTTKPAEAPKSTAEKLAQEKDELVKSAKADLDRLQKGLSDLQAKAEARGAEVKADFGKLKADVETKMAATKEELGKVEASTAETWAKVKAGVQKALSDVKETYQKAVARVEGKPEAPAKTGAATAETPKPVAQRLSEEKDQLVSSTKADLDKLQKDLTDLQAKCTLPQLR